MSDKYAAGEKEPSDKCPTCGYHPCKFELAGPGNRLCDRCGFRYFILCDGDKDRKVDADIPHVKIPTSGSPARQMPPVHLQVMDRRTDEARQRKYVRIIRGSEDPTKTLEVDVMSVCQAFQRDHLLAQVVKKVLCPGERGTKDMLRDLKEAHYTLGRFIRDHEAEQPPSQKPLEP